MKIDPNLDLVLERVVDVPPELVWKAWTTPEHLCKWFCPKPWYVSDCEIDLKPGGIFQTTMCGPNGERFTNAGCYLEVVPTRKLVWTDALKPGFRPSPTAVPGQGLGGFFTAMITIEPHGMGTKYTATALHTNEEGRKAHEAMGFHHGWGAALDQLVELAKTWQ